MDPPAEPPKKPEVPKYPDRFAGGHSAFLQKKLAKGQKFFDSGDYELARQKMGRGKDSAGVPPGLRFPYATDKPIPTPENVRKVSSANPVDAKAAAAAAATTPDST